jgi:nucleotide-binding universal stress UspA family protein
MDIRHILVTTDLSPEATRPFEAVKELALEAGASITLLCVVPELAVVAAAAMSYAPLVAPETFATELAEADRAIRAQREMFGPQVAVASTVLSGNDVGETVAKYAKNHEIDLIALSTHGRSGLRRLMMGSAAEDILRHASVPVLIFPPDEE